MSKPPAVSKTDRLLALENVIRDGMEKFVATGFALMEIRDNELYAAVGFENWESYLKERIAKEFGIEKRQAFNLIACAQIRGKLSQVQHAALEDKGWSQRELIELARLAPKDKSKAGHPPDYDRLKRQDVTRVANKVLEHCEEEGIHSTALVVRKFVDADLGIDRAALAKEPRSGGKRRTGTTWGNTSGMQRAKSRL
jgi:hypothetical protein